MHPEGRIHDLLGHFVFCHVTSASKKNLSPRRQDAKKTFSCRRDLRNNTRGPGRTGNWKSSSIIGPRSGSWSRRTGVNRSRDESITQCGGNSIPAGDAGDRGHRYLNVYVPTLQRAGGVASFFRFHRGHQFASSAWMDPITKALVAQMEQFAKQENVPIVLFEKGQRKDDVAAAYRKKFTAAEGVLFIGKAQEKTPVIRTERRRNEQTGATYPWLVRSTAMVNHFYVYCIDRDFGPFFLKFCTYFPYNAQLCLNGHEYVKQQLTHRGIGYEALDNGIVSCADPQRVQAICDGLSAEKIERLLRKWFRKLPHPFTAKDRQAGYRYQISILQAEFSLTQVLDRPVSGRIFFEEVIRENLDIGRPSQVPLIFDRRVSRRTPGRFRTRVITDGVVPSLHVDYQNSRIKQYHQEGRALRTETTINNTRDFGIGKLLKNLPALRQVGFQANRRLLDVQTISHDCSIGEDAFDQVVRPIQVEGQRASALRFGDARGQALLSALVLFSFQLRGFTNQRKQHSLSGNSVSSKGMAVPPSNTDRQTV